ncbi:uncharacterized protein LOC106139601 [Amyelois transitella]|uniref:uncharacterized protein LOC106139601 n=1 Tax=Amyelois transitella TaxID=680683 RepID=UPI00298F70EF|nr:uncharacterized protein LOC106139601 [Amyelois transitella]
MNADKDISFLHSLPDEIIDIILKYMNFKDLTHFSMTCKRFYEYVSTNMVLWKNVYKTLLPEMFETRLKYGNGEWHREVREYLELQKLIFTQLEEAASRYYLKTNITHFVDVCELLNHTAIAEGGIYYNTVCILQGVINETRRMLNSNTSEPPFTLTHMHYAKIALRYYFHAFLALKWSIFCNQPEKPSPLQVITFFVQWIYHTDLEADDASYFKISALANRVDEFLKEKTKGQSVLDPAARLECRISDAEVLKAISHVLYKTRSVVSETETANFDTLDVLKVFKNKCGHRIVTLSVYQAIAAKFGIYSELQVFPNHLYLEWKSNWTDPNEVGYIIDVYSGNMRQKRGCPFSRGSINNYRYDHLNLIEFLYKEHRRTMGYIRDIYTQNAQLLTEFLGMRGDFSSTYTNIEYSSHQLILDHYELAVGTPLQAKHLTASHMNFILQLFVFNVNPKPLYRDTVSKKHPACVKYAVGMICTNKQTQCKCVILGWNSEYDSASVPRPSYTVLDSDQFQRYAYQDMLEHDPTTSRLIHLEDIMAKDFTHYNGFRYVANVQKMQEYPDDEAIAMAYQNGAFDDGMGSYITGNDVGAQ